MTQICVDNATYLCHIISDTYLCPYAAVVTYGGSLMSSLIELCFGEFMSQYLMEIDGSLYLLADGWFESLIESLVVCLSCVTVLVTVSVFCSLSFVVSVVRFCKTCITNAKSKEM